MGHSSEVEIIPRVGSNHSPQKPLTLYLISLHNGCL